MPRSHERAIGEFHIACKVQAPVYKGKVVAKLLRIEKPIDADDAKRFVCLFPQEDKYLMPFIKYARDIRSGILGKIPSVKGLTWRITLSTLRSHPARIEVACSCRNAIGVRAAIFF